MGRPLYERAGFIAMENEMTLAGEPEQGAAHEDL